MTSNTTQKNQKDLSGQWNWLVDDDNSTMIFPRKSLQGLKSFPLWNTRGYQTASVFRPSDITCASKNWIFWIDNSFGTGWTFYKMKWFYRCPRSHFQSSFKSTSFLTQKNVAAGLLVVKCDVKDAISKQW